MPTPAILRAAAALVHGLFRSRLALQIEILALRHQLTVYQRTCRRPRLKPTDRLLWAWLSRIWSGWRNALVIVKPETVIAWRRRKFRQPWAKPWRSGKPGRPAVPLLLRDRDTIHGEHFCRRARNMGIEQVVIAARSSSQNPFVERLIGGVRRECLDHTIALNEQHVKRVLTDYFRYYRRRRTLQSLKMDSPEGRETHPVDRGRVIEVAETDALHHH